PKLSKFADGGLSPASNLKILPTERLEQQTWQDNLRDNPAWQMLMEITGIAPSFRLTKQIKDLGSVVLKPQTAFEWADRVAGMATNTLETALSAVDLAGASGAVSSTIRNTVGGFLTKNPKALSKLTKPLRNQRGMIGEIDLDTASRLPLEERIKLAMEMEGGDPSDLAKWTAATRKLVGDAKDPIKDVLKNIPKGPAEEILDLKKLQATGQAKEIALSKGRQLDTNKVYYHGTASKIDRLEGRSPDFGGSIYTTGDLGTAAAHAYKGGTPNVKAFTIHSKNPLDMFSEVTENHKQLVLEKLEKKLGRKVSPDIFKDAKKWI
ncbi:unnamed protein product, partial [marine sediment metagenome]